MFTDTFNPFLTKSITFCYNCVKCGTEIEEMTTGIPKPKMDAEKDTHNATVDMDIFEIVCPKCEEIYNVQLSSSILAGELYCDNLPDDTEVKKVEY